MVKLGYRVRDLVTGFHGIATARTDYLYGCVHVAIAPPVGADGKLVPSEWFDEQRVEIIEATAPPLSKSYSATSGGPADSPPSRPTPSAFATPGL